MVCDRCKMVVKSELEKLGYSILSVELGHIELLHSINPSEKEQIRKTLEALGFFLIDDKKSLLIERIKNLIIELVHKEYSALKTNLSDHLSSHLLHDYHYLSNLFSAEEGTTIEKYFIAQKIEKVKEYLVYDELSLSEIAYRMNYSSVAYLSSQFKKVTGLTPSQYKNLEGNKRTPLDQL